MASKSLGQLTIDLVAKIGGWTDGLSKAERELDTRTKRMNRMAYNFGRSFGASIKSAAGSFLAFAGVTVSIGAVVSSLKSAIDRADELRDASIRLGVGVDVLSKWSYAAKQTGTDIEGLNKGLRQLAKNATEALDPKSQQAGLFQALGISKDALGDLTKLVPQLADAFQRLPDGPQKTAVAMQLLGKSGADLIEFFDQGGKGLKDFGDKLENLGGVVTPEAAAAADKFNDDLDDLKTSFGGVANEVAQRLLPKLDKFIVDLNSPGMRQGLATIVEGLANIITVAGEAAAAVGGLAHALSVTFSASGSLKDYDDLLAKRAQLQEKLAAPYTKAVDTGLFFGTSTKELNSQINSIDKRLDALRKKQAAAAFDATHPVNDHHSGTGQFANVNMPAGAAGINNALSNYLAGAGAVTGGRGGGSARKAADDSADALKRLTEAQDEWHGRVLDMVADLAGPVAQAERDYQKALDDLNKSYSEGKVRQEDYAKAQELLAQQRDAEIAKIKEQLSPAQELIQSMQAELSLIGLTNAEREKAIALRQAGADATDAERAKIADLVGQMQMASREADFWNETQRDLSDALFNTVTGAESAGDAIKGFFDDLARYITRMISEQWAQKITDLFKRSADSSSGSGWGGFLSALLGGVAHNANGGTVTAFGLSEVNERGFEMASVGGRDYLLAGSSPVEITPHHALTGPGMTQNFNFALAAPTDPRTQAQIAQRAAFETRRASSRNS